MRPPATILASPWPAGANLTRQSQHVQKALKISPYDAEAYNNLGVVQAQRGQRDKAIALYRKALEIQPNYPEAHNNLGYALASLGRFDEAMAHYRKVLQIRPDFAQAHNNLAWLQATCPEATRRNGAEAVEHAQRADQLCGGGRPDVLNTLAAAYAEAGRFPEALATAGKALELANRQNNHALVGVLRTRIALYEAGKPYHQTPSASASLRPTP